MVTNMEKGEIQAVHDDDLVNLLKSLEIYNDIEQGKKRCYFCNGIITLNNILSVFPYQNDIQICCSDDECYEKLLDFKKSKGE
jgi:hypothetical protein